MLYSFRKTTNISVLFLFSSITLVNAQSNSVEIWIRSFIPNEAYSGAASSNILKNPSGTGSLVQVVPKDIPFIGNLISALTPTSCFDPDFDRVCFVTDGRGFSLDPSTTARTDTKFTITFIANNLAKVSPNNGRTTAGITKRLNCTTGIAIEEKEGKINTDAIGTPAVAGNIIQVAGQVTATDQLVPCATTLLTPSADCSFDLKWNRSSSELSIDFTFGIFPAFEIYARQPGNEWIPVLQELPSGQAWQLAGDGLGFSVATLRKTVKVKLLSIDGNWHSPAPDERFTLEIMDRKVKWIERSPSGITLTRELPIIDLGGNKFKIERANDGEVLSFLGFSQGIKNDILAKAPQPSYIVLSRTGTKLEIEWNGIMVTKDNQGNLKEIIQLGTRPAKMYHLTRF